MRHCIPHPSMSASTTARGLNRTRVIARCLGGDSLLHDLIHLEISLILDTYPCTSLHILIVVLLRCVIEVAPRLRILKTRYEICRKCRLSYRKHQPKYHAVGPTVLATLLSSTSGIRMPMSTASGFVQQLLMRYMTDVLPGSHCVLPAGSISIDHDDGFLRPRCPTRGTFQRL